MSNDDDNSTARGYGLGWEYVAVGFTFAFAILGFGALGWLVDGWLGTRPLFAIVGAFLGGFGGFMNIYYRVKRDSEARKP
jgi:F0F1-type ATP synthase assembly protein I